MKADSLRKKSVLTEQQSSSFDEVALTEVDKKLIIIFSTVLIADNFKYRED